MKTVKSSDLPDLRQRRTRRYLADALLSLLEERPLSQISVVDICQKAMVHRTTFYSHFDDKHELLRWTVSDLMQKEFEMAGSNACVTDLKEYFLAVFQSSLEFMKEHRGLFLEGNGNETEVLLLESTVADELCHRLSNPAVLPPELELEPKITSHFYAGAILSLIHWWLNSKVQITQQTLLRHLDRFLPSFDLTSRIGCCHAK